MNSSNDFKFQVPANSGPSVVASKDLPASSTGSGQAEALTLMQLEQLLDNLEDINDNPSATKTRAKAQASKEELLQDVVNLLKTGLSKGLKTDPTQVRNMVALTAKTLNDYTATDPTATGFVVAEISLSIHDFLVENPNDHNKVLFAFSPLITLCGGSVTAKIKQMNIATVKFQEAFAKADPATAKSELEQLMTQLVGSGSGKVLASVLNSIKGELNSLDVSDVEKYKSLVRSLYDMVSLAALSNPQKAQEVVNTVLNNGFISSVYALEKTQMDGLFQSALTVMREMTNPNSTNLTVAMSVLQEQFTTIITNGGVNSGCGFDIVGNMDAFLNTYKSLQTQNTPNLSTILGQAMLSFQQFEQTISQSQANQDQATIAIGEASVKSSMDLQTQLDTQITQEEQDLSEANSHPWYDYLIEAVVAVIAVIVSAVTAGVGAAIAAALVAGFMASPLGSEAQNAIAEKIAGGSEQDLYNQYVSEGMSPTDAQTKAAAEWNKAMGFAGLVLVAATIIVTAGVGGIGGASDAAAQALKVGLTQGLTMMAALDPMLNFLLSDPSIANNNTLVLALGITLEVGTTLLALGAGCLAADANPQGLSRLFSSSIMPLIVTNGLVGVGSSAYSMYTGIQESGYLQDTADLEASIGVLNEQSTICQGIIKMNEQTQTNINTSNTSIINSIGADMSAIENMGSQLVPVGG